MTRDNLLGTLLSIPAVDSAQLSPDRRWVAFVWQHVTANEEVFVVPADGSAPPLQLTSTPEETRLVSWAPDSRSVIVSEDHDGDERGRLFRVAIATPGIREPLTEPDPPYFLQGGRLSPDGRTLFYSMNYDIAAAALTESSVLYRQDLASGERTAIAQALRASWAEPQINSAGTYLLHGRVDRSPGGEQIHLVDVEGGEDREIISAGDARKARGEWLPDGRRVLFVAEAVDGSYQRVGTYDIVSGATRWLLDDPERQIEAAWVTRDGMVVVDEVIAARRHPLLLDPDSGALEAFPQLLGNLTPLGRNAAGAWVAIHASATTPNDLVLLEGAAAQLRARSLTRYSERVDVAALGLVAAEDFRWRSADGLEVQGWLYRAPAARGRAVLYIHGGPTWHSEERLSVEIQYLIARGFHVLDINYRGSTGFGLSYRESIKVDGWGGREQDDIRAGAAALIAAGLAMPGGIGITGTSYGGYSSWCQIVHSPPDLIGAAIPICGMTDLVVDYETTRPDLRPYSEEMIGGRPDQAPERYYERSPMNFVQNIRGKLLIVQGAQDPNVTPENVRQVIERLDAASLPYELLEFADEGHGINRPTNQAILYRRMADFFDAALAQRA